jgi:hypothetical protein
MKNPLTKVGKPIEIEKRFYHPRFDLRDLLAGVPLDISKPMR